MHDSLSHIFTKRDLRFSLVERWETLIGHGYSPVPIKPGTKRPLPMRWSEACNQAFGSEALREFASEWPNAGTGIALGYKGLVAIDIDTDDAEFIAAFRKLVPESTVAKRGQKGRTDFYRCASPIETARYDGRDGSRLLEVLATGTQTVIPLTMHPDTGQPYEFLTEATLYDTPLRALPWLRASIEAIEETIKPWLPEEPDYLGERLKPRAAGAIDEALHRRYLAWARAKLDARCAQLAGMTSGRNTAAYKLACGIGCFVHNRILDESEVQAAILDACRQNGYIKEEGQRAVVATIRSGLNRARNDALPELQDRPRPNGSSDKTDSGDAQTTEPEPRTVEFSDDALAVAFAAAYGDRLRYVARFDSWFRWDGQRWREDERPTVYELARPICREAAERCDKPHEAKALTSATTVAAVERLARGDVRHRASIDQWDADPMLLNTPGGVVDLRTGEMVPHRADLYMTKMTAVAPGGDCPRWRQFLREVTQEDKALEEFLARKVGYSLTGATREHALFFLHGPGGNGKSVYINVIAGIMGDYHRGAPIETFTASHSDRHPTELAMLKGARLVTAVETEEGRRWAETKIKTLTGGDRIMARFMRQDFFEYLPQFKLAIAGNHKPGLRSVDEAIRRRFHLIPFNVKIPAEKRDPNLGEKLQAEWPGILQWAVDGCVDWLERGLAPPDAVIQATASYLENEDAFGQWLEECCYQNINTEDTSARLWSSWKAWAENGNRRVGTRNDFSEQLEIHGFSQKRGTGGARSYMGLKVLG
jgi:putative DNA primase/helicase